LLSIINAINAYNVIIPQVHWTQHYLPIEIREKDNDEIDDDDEIAIFLVNLPILDFLLFPSIVDKNKNIFIINLFDLLSIISSHSIDSNVKWNLETIFKKSSCVYELTLSGFSQFILE